MRCITTSAQEVLRVVATKATEEERHSSTLVKKRPGCGGLPLSTPLPSPPPHVPCCSASLPRPGSLIASDGLAGWRVSTRFGVPLRVQDREPGLAVHWQHLPRQRQSRRCALLPCLRIRAIPPSGTLPRLPRGWAMVMVVVVSSLLGICPRTPFEVWELRRRLFLLPGGFRGFSSWAAGLRGRGGEPRRNTLNR